MPRPAIRVVDHEGWTVYYLGGIVFALLAVLLVVVFIRKFRQSND